MANYGDHTISVIDTASNTVTDTISVGTGPIKISFSPDGSKAYVANEGSGTVSLIDTASGTVIRTIPVGLFPTSVAFSPDGSKAYVTNLGNDNVSVISFAPPISEASPIPTLSEWAMILMASLMGLLAFVRMRRQ